MKLKVVPELSERCAIEIFVDGSETPLFSFAIAGLFQVVILPMKMLASVGPSIFNRFGAPGRLYMTAVAPSAHGICSHPLQAENWSGVNGASLAPKSTVRDVIAATPAPEPTPLYCSSYP